MIAGSINPKHFLAILLFATLCGISWPAAAQDSCTVENPRSYPYWDLYEEIVVNEYTKKSTKDYSDRDLDDMVKILGHAIGRIGLAAGESKERQDLVACLQKGLLQYTGQFMLFGFGDHRVTAREAWLGYHNDEVAEKLGYRDDAPYEAFFTALGIAPAPPKTTVHTPHPTDPRHPWLKLCEHELNARGVKPLFHYQHVPFANVNVYDDPMGGYLQISGCNKVPFDLAASEREHSVQGIDRPGTGVYREIVTYKRNNENTWITFSYYSDLPHAPRPGPKHPWDGICEREIRERWQPIFHFSQPPFRVEDIFVDPVSNTYMSVVGCAKNPFDPQKIMTGFRIVDTSYPNSGAFYKVETFEHLEVNESFKLSWYNR